MGSLTLAKHSAIEAFLEALSPSTGKHYVIYQEQTLQLFLSPQQPIRITTPASAGTSLFRESSLTSSSDVFSDSSHRLSLNFPLGSPKCQK